MISQGFILIHYTQLADGLRLCCRHKKITGDKTDYIIVKKIMLV